MVGGKDGIAQFFYEATQLIGYLQKIGFPDHDLYEVTSLEVWTFFTELQFQKSPIWGLIADNIPGTDALTNFIRFSPEKLARILTSKLYRKTMLPIIYIVYTVLQFCDISKWHE